MAGTPPFEGPVKVTAFATFAIPASWSKKRKAEARFHTGKPDADNIAKAIGDGLNGILWRDDSQVSICIVAKVYGESFRGEDHLERLLDEAQALVAEVTSRA